jgi:nucleotide-binding universal stress UspA family protein
VSGTAERLAVVVVGVDGSAGAGEALRWAVAEARLRGTRLRVVHAWESGFTGMAGGVARHFSAVRSTASRRQASVAFTASPRESSRGRGPVARFGQPEMRPRAPCPVVIVRTGTPTAAADTPAASESDA